MAACTHKAVDSSPDEKPPDVVWARRTPRVKKDLKKRSPKTPKTEISELVSVLGEQNASNDVSPPHLLDMWLRSESIASSASSTRETPGSVRRASKRPKGDHPLAELRKKKHSERLAAMQQQLTLLEKENVEPLCADADLEELVGSLDATLFDGIDDDVPHAAAAAAVNTAAEQLPCPQLRGAAATAITTSLGTKPLQPRHTTTAAPARLPRYAPPRPGATTATATAMFARRSGALAQHAAATPDPNPSLGARPVVPSPQDLQRIQINQKRAAALRRKRQRERRQAET